MESGRSNRIQIGAQPQRSEFDTSEAIVVNGV